jgi:maltose alpha-D-glucosyltransferase / alpha-amylase
MTGSILPNMSVAELRENLVQAIPDFLLGRRWFGSKARSIRSAEVADIVPLVARGLNALLVLARIHYASGPDETYSLPLIANTDRAPLPEAPSLKLRPAGKTDAEVFYDALSNEIFLDFLLDAIAQGQSFSGEHGEVTATSSTALQSLWEPSEGRLQPSLMKAEQSNSSIVYGKRLVLKLFRRLEEGINPDLEIGSFLTSRARFPNVPAVAGQLEYVINGQRSSLGILQAFVPNQGDAWQFTLKALAGYYERAARAEIQPDENPPDSLLALAEREIPPQTQAHVGPYLESARLLGKRTAELHLALCSDPHDPAFSPEPFRVEDGRVLCDSALDLLTRTFDSVRQKLPELPVRAQEKAQKLLSLEESARQRFGLLRDLQVTAMRCRIHGDYHLGQILFTGDDFMIIDFEGEPARPLSERRTKRLPLQDVAGMLRSFHYAAYAPILGEADSVAKLDRLDPWSRYWHKWVSTMFLKTYLEVSGGAPYLPRTRSELEILLDIHILDKAVYELGYELNNRPHWAAIPLEGVLSSMAVAH